LRIAALSTALALGTLACGTSAPSSTAIVRDSAGIRIVENDAAQWSDASAWRLAEQPGVTIGVVDGELEYQLFRASRALALSNGRIVIANIGTQELRYYDPAGRFLQTVGGRGGGPGEFERMEWARRTNGDSVMVFERDASVSLFDDDGQYVDGFRIETGLGSNRHYVGWFTSGRYLSLPRIELSYDAFMELPSGISRERAAGVTYDETGTLVDTIGIFPHWWFDTQRRAIPGTGRRQPVQLGLWFSPQVVAATFADSFYLGTGDTYEIGLYDTIGALRRIIRKTHEPRRVTQADVDRGVAYSAVVWGPGTRMDTPYNRAMIGWLAETPAQEYFPPYGDGFLVDADRNLWVEQYEAQRSYEGMKPGSPMFDVADRRVLHSDFQRLTLAPDCQCHGDRSTIRGEDRTRPYSRFERLRLAGRYR
jgi:hypothetical protein